MERSHYRTFIYLNMNGLCYKYNVYNKADLHTDQETYKVNKSHLLEYDLYGLKIQNIYFITNICSAFPNVQFKVVLRNNFEKLTKNDLTFEAFELDRYSITVRNYAGVQLLIQ